MHVWTCEMCVAEFLEFVQSYIIFILDAAAAVDYADGAQPS